MLDQEGQEEKGQRGWDGWSDKSDSWEMRDRHNPPFRIIARGKGVFRLGEGKIG